MKQKHKRVLTKVAIIYPVFALVLLPWTLYLSQSLPEHNLTIHWDVSWVGLNILLIVSLAATGYFSYIQSRWVAMSATVLGSVLILDAWFDVLSQRGGDELKQAILMALFIELPIAAASFIIAGRALSYNQDSGKHINPYIKRHPSKKRKK
jgi:hypothetical protein